MTNNEHIELISRIQESSLFENKLVLKKLLDYLFEKKQSSQTIHEIDVAIDIFNRKNHFDASDDTIVRVNIHKLRKALERYAMDEGKNEKYSVIIPKGSYSLQFACKKDAKKQLSLSNKIIACLLVILIIILGLNIYSIFSKSAHSHLVWNDYLKSDLPICITLADPFFFRAINQSTNENYIVRDISINSVNDLDSFALPEFESGKFELAPLEYAYFSQNNIWPLLNITTVFSQADKDLRLMPLSNLKADDIKRFNHIVIGNINSLGVFNQYLHHSSIKVKTNPRRIFIMNQKDTLEFNIDEIVTGYYVDHAFIVKVPGPNNNVISLIGDFHASGNKGLLHFINDKELYQKLITNANSNSDAFPEFFEMVVEVKSYNYEDFETKVVYFNQLK